MRIKFLAAAAVTVLLVAAAAVILSCQDGTTAPTRETNPNMDEEYVIVQGYVYDGGDPPQKLEEAVVTWYCETCGDPIGEDMSDHYDKYYIRRSDRAEEHAGHTLKGYAEHAVWGISPEVEIGTYEPDEIPYDVDIYY